MPSAFVHIGLHKAGSTYLQMILFRSRPALAQAGIHYVAFAPKDAVRRMRKLVDSGKVREEDALWEPTALRKALAKAPADKHLILSCESLESLGRWPRSMADLHAMLLERYERVSYFVVVRHVVDHAASLMQQGAKGFHAKNLGRKSKFLRGRPLQNGLRSFFEGDYPLTVFDFDTFVKGDTPAQLAQLLSEKLAIPPPALQDRPASNESIGAMGVAFMLALTHLLREALGSRTPRLFQWPHFKAVQVHTRDAIRNRLDTGTRFMPFTEEEQLEVIRRAREASAPFIERFPGTWADGVYSERVRPYGVVLLSELEGSERDRVASQILETWGWIERLLRKDFELRQDFDARVALDRYLERERELMFPESSGTPIDESPDESPDEESPEDARAREAARAARKEARKAKRRAERTARAETGAAPQHGSPTEATTAREAARAARKEARRTRQLARRAGAVAGTDPAAARPPAAAPATLTRRLRRALSLLLRRAGGLLPWRRTARPRYDPSTTAPE